MHQSISVQSIKTLLSVVVTLSLVSCGSANQDPRHEMASSARTGTAEEIRAAKALSLGNVRAISIETDPYVRVLRCNLAIAAVQAHFAGSGLPDDQKELLQMAKDIYGRELVRLSKQKNKSEEQVQADLGSQTENFPDLSSKAQIMIGCLQTLV